VWEEWEKSSGRMEWREMAREEVAGDEWRRENGGK